MYSHIHFVARKAHALTVLLLTISIFSGEILNSKLFSQNVGLDSIMAVTNDDKIAKLEAKIASLQLQHDFLNDHIKMIQGKNPTLEAKVKAVMDWNQNLQLKVLGEVDSK